MAVAEVVVVLVVEEEVVVPVEVEEVVEVARRWQRRRSGVGWSA